MSRSFIPDLLAAYAFISCRCPHALIEDGKVLISTACARCGGSGNTGHYQDGGVCYACWGANTRNSYQRVPVLEWARREHSRQQQAEKRRAARVAAAAAAEAAKLEGQRKYNEERGHGRLTFDELQQKQRAELPPVVPGRREIVATVLKVKAYESDYGVTWKMTVKCKQTGNLYFGSQPSSLNFVTYVRHYEATSDYPAADVQEQRGLQRGDVVRFTATVEASEKDPTFGLFSRPAKAVVVNPQETPAGI